ncbi:MAG: putative Exopolyphosphatase [Nitrospira sp.]|jgi:exopolyphosphatase/guanosine-5'-triphosphate,3'-diphosphate pyrophosphatase|nr:putative Exopolyphosphatase [Nitrospira sp.]
MRNKSVTASPTPSPRILAGIDIGTLTCRLLIAEFTSSGRLRERRSERRILRLGQGVDRDHLLHADAMERVIGTLKEWRQIIDNYHVEASTAVATSAVRDARNREEFVILVKREAGFDVELITGEEEARRTMLGIRSGLPPGVTDLLALDIGGGSTEFILGQPGRPTLARSIDIGVVRLSERTMQHDPPTAEEIQQAREWVRNESRIAIGDLQLPNGLTFVGTAGAVTSLASMAQQLSVYEPVRIHNYVLKLESVKALEEQLLSKSKAQREGMPGLERGREEVIAAGAIILRTAMETLGMSECLVSDLGLREGVLIDLATRIAER